MRMGKERTMIAACLCLLAMLWIVPRSAEGSTEGQKSAESIVSQCTNRTDKPPEWGHYKKWSTDALLMGNGDMGLNAGPWPRVKPQTRESPSPNSGRSSKPSTASTARSPGTTTRMTGNGA